MSVYDKLEEAGHDVTLVVGMQVGVSTYVCERCGSLVKVRNDEVILFHAPGSSIARQEECAGPKPAEGRALRDKLRDLEAADMEAFRRAMED